MKCLRSVLSLLLVTAMLGGNIPMTLYAAGSDEKVALTETELTFDPRRPELFIEEDAEEEEEYAPDEIVRVSIILEEEPAIDQGYPIQSIANDQSAIDYQEGLDQEQEKVIDRIEENVLDGERLDVVTRLTLVANLISADVEYAQIEEIEQVTGVEEVVIERVYEPLEEEESSVEGTDGALAEMLTEYTGAGARIAILDSGVNHDHQSFNDGAFEYSLQRSAPDTDGSDGISSAELAEYKKQLDLMEQEDVTEALGIGRLHVVDQYQQAGMLYQNSKIPFAYNYADNNLSIKNAEAGIHGSHVAGIAAANTYIPKDGDYVKAVENGGMAGTAPDAQILNMKVFGNGECTDSVLATAIEDAVILGADVLNLSLGQAEVGFSCAGQFYGNILDDLSEHGILIMGAIGNDGSWVAENKNGRPNKLYVEDVNLSTTTPPSSYAEFMGVAWADGYGSDGKLPKVDESSSYGIPSSLMLQPEITAAGTMVNSVDGSTENGYKELSGTSMSAPDVAGAAAVVHQYLHTGQTWLGGDSFLSRAMEQSATANQGRIAGGLLMSTADPMMDENGQYVSLLRQGAGLLNVKKAASARSFLEIGGQPRGRVKAEVGDSPDGSNTFTYTFALHNIGDEERDYSFRTDLFTQDIVREGEIDYLSDQTRRLEGTVRYEVDGKPLYPSSELEADVDRNHETNDDDAKALLDYLSGRRGEEGLDLQAADVDHDERPTTYDAHLILKRENVNVSTVPVAAQSSVNVKVTIQITEKIKEKYPNGTYLEGFTYVIPDGQGEEAADVTHTIPILGFCGSWSDPSMFDRNSYIESSNGMNATVPYTRNPAEVYDINYLAYQDKSGKTLRLTTNPFESTRDIPLDRLAMSEDDTIYNVKLTLIRPAGALCFALMTDAGNGKRKVQYMDVLYTHRSCAYPAPQSEQNGGWNYRELSLSVRKSLEKMLAGTDVEAGSVVELGVVAVPEYYEETPGKTISRTYLKTLIEEGRLGKGAYLTTKVTIDDQAPAVVGETIDVSVADQTISAAVEDDQHVAYVGLYSTDGQKKYGSFSPQKEDDQSFTCTLKVNNLQAGGEYALLVGDYAGNSRMYHFTYGERPDYQDTRQALVYLRSGGGGSIQGNWVLLYPDRFSCSAWGETSNMTPVAHTDASQLLAGADAADGYLWQAFENGLLYAAPIDEVNKRMLIGDLSAAGLQTVRDLAFSQSDQMLYAVDGTDVLWRIDPMDGSVQAVQKIALQDGVPAQLYGLAVKNDGTVYATHFEETENKEHLLIWRLTGQEMRPGTDAPAESVEAVKKELTGISGRYISLAWSGKDQSSLYAACAEDLNGPSPAVNYMYRISGLDEESCTVLKSNEGISENSSRLYNAVRGLVYLPAVPSLGLIDEEPGALSGIHICQAPAEMLAGDTAALSVAFVPWNAQADPARITWRSDRPEVADVGADGILTASGEGTAQITAEYQTEDGQTFTDICTVVVEPALSVQVSALIREDDGYYYWETFNTASPNVRQKLSGAQRGYIAGTMNQEKDCLYVRDISYGYRIDPETFETVQTRGAFYPEIVQGDAAPGRSHGYLKDYGYITVIGDTLRLFGGNVWGGKGFQEVGRHFTIRSDELPGTPAAIAYEKYIDECGYHTEDDAPAGADLYYLLQEDGSLYRMTIYDQYGIKVDRLGKIQGVNLGYVTQMQEDATASMIFDEASQCLVLVSKIKTGKARVQVIDPETRSLLMTREFDDGVRQIGILYQYGDVVSPGALEDRSNAASDTSAADAAADAAAKAVIAADSAACAVAADVAAAVREMSSAGTVTVNGQEHTVSVRYLLNDTTNGLAELTYDQELLTFQETRTSLPFYSCNADGGVVKIAFADRAAIEGEDVEIVFSYQAAETEKSAAVHFEEKEHGNPEEIPALDNWEGSALLPAEPEEKNLTSIKVTTKPSKLEYLEGKDTLDLSGGKVTLYYDNDTSEEIDLTPQMVTSDFDNTKIGTQKIEVEYEGKKDSFEVTVRAKSLTSIKVTTKPSKLEYLEGKDALDLSGGKVTLYYDNDTSEEIELTPQMVTSDFDNTKVGTQKIEVEYEGKKDSFEVTVRAKSLTSIKVTTKPSKLEYLEGKDTLDLSGGKVTLYYDNDTSEEIELTPQMVTGDFDNTKVGTQKIEVGYEGKKDSFEVTVRAKSLTSIKVTTKPSKLEYLEGKDALDLSGGKVTLYYDNDTSEEIELTPQMVTSDFDNTKVGPQKIEVEYEGKTDSFEVTVKKKEELPTLTLDKKTLTLLKKTATDTLEVTAAGENADKLTDWTWTSSDPSVSVEIVQPDPKDPNAKIDPKMAAVTSALLERQPKEVKITVSAKLGEKTVSAECTVKVDNWYADIRHDLWPEKDQERLESALKSVSDPGWMEGYLTTEYEDGRPRFGLGNLLRYQFALIVYRMAGSPAVDASAKNPFTDVTEKTVENEEARKAILWAQKEGVINGYDAERFGPNEKITRAQMMTMMYRYATKVKKLTTAPSEFSDLSQFGSEVNEIQNDEMKEAIQWCVGKEIVGGVTENGVLKLRPQGFAKREQCAIVVAGFAKVFDEVE